MASTYEDTRLRRDNQEHNIAEYRAGKLRLDSRPLALFVELTQNCGVIEDRYASCRYSYAQRYVDFEDWIHPAGRHSVKSTETALALTARRDPASTPAVPWM